MSDSPRGHLDGPAPFDAVDIRAALASRRHRPPNYKAEGRALSRLVAEMAANPPDMLQKLAQTALDLCHADSAGISLLDTQNGSVVFRWEAVAGTLSTLRNNTMPRDASPCGVCIDQNSLQLMYLADRFFPALPGQPRFVETLLIPFHSHGRPIGTVWVVMHQFDRQFDREDERLMEVLAAFASASWQVSWATVEMNFILMKEIDERRRVEEELRDSESRFRATFFQAAVGITQANISGEFELANDRFCEILGYSQAELLGMTFLQITHRDYQDACLAAIDGLLRGEISSFCTEKRLVRRDGAAVWARVNVSLVRNQNNQPQYFIGIVQDINEQMQAELALRETERRLTLALSAGGLGVWEFDLRTKTVSAPPTYAGIFGPRRTIDEWLAVIHPNDLERVLAAGNEAVAANRDWEVEYRVPWPDGSIRWVLSKSSIVFGDAGEAVRIVGVSLDITERKQAEAVLRESEELFRNLADTAPVMMWIEAADKRCTFLNKRWLIFTGRSLEQELGFGWADGIHPDDYDRCLDSHKAAFEARENFHIEYRLRRADGVYRWVLCSGVPRFTPSGEFLGYIGSDFDITDLKLAQQQALERQKIESLGVLTSGIAHDFNNLLGSILADAELAELDVAAGSHPEEQIGRIKAVAIRAAEIVRELMIYSGQDNTDFGPVDLSRLVEEMVELLRVSISKHAVLKTDLAPNLPPMRGNPAQIRQVVMNLIINASEAIGERNGLIHVATSFTKGGGTLPEGDYLRLDVSDTGCGVTEEQKARIFDPFFSTKFAGRGLGLAVVQGIVRGHGGGIYLNSTPGQGSTFQILLPCIAGVPDRSSPIPDSVPDTNRSAATLLFVDDEESLRYSVSKILSRNGFSVVGAGDGSAAVDLLRGHPGEIDLILLDMTLPGTSSREVLGEAQRTRPDVKVILTSAYSREMVAQSLDAPIVKGFIRKPFQAGDLLKLLHATLNSSASAQFG